MSGLDSLNPGRSASVFRQTAAPSLPSENFRTQYLAQSRNSSMLGLETEFAAVYQENIDKAAKLTGKELSRPDFSVYKDLARELERPDDKPIDDDFFTSRRLDRAREKEVELRSIKSQFPEVMTTQEIWAETKKRAAQRERDASNTSENPGLISTLSGFAGGMAGSFTYRDPINLGTLGVGGVGKNVLIRVAEEAGLNGLVEAMNQVGFVQENRELLGLEYGPNQVLQSVGYAAAGAGLIRGGIEAVPPLARGVQKGAGLAKSLVVEKAAKLAETKSFVPQSVKDYVTAYTRNTHIEESAPFQVVNVNDRVAHKKAFTKTISDIEAYKRPSADLPDVKKIVTPRNELELEVKPRVVELDEIITSDMKEYDQSLQPRDRSNRIASDVRINEIAARLDPAQLGDSRVSNTGSPIVGPDMMTESGNGRIMALKKAYDEHPESAAKYRDFLKTQGFSVKGMKRPVLIRQRLSDLTPDQRKQFVIYSNEDVADRLSTTERALADAKLMNVERYQGGDASLEVNANFVRDFVDKAVSPAERNAFFTPGGKVSQDGIKRVRAALLAKAYSDAGLIQRLLEDTDNNIKTIGKVLMDIAGEWANLRAAVARGEVPPQFDITRDLMAAVETIINARDANRPITDYINQTGLFAETNLTAEATAILRGLYKDNLTQAQGEKNVRDFLGFYVREANKVKGGPDLLGEKQLQPMDILTKALEKMHGKEATAEFKFDIEASPEIKALRDAGLEKMAAEVRHPKTGQTLMEALDDMASRPETINEPGYKSKERKALHKQIVNKLINDNPDVKTGKTMEIVLGPTGAGKSSVVVKRLQKELGAIVVDSDIVKERLPEYDNGIGAHAVHEESKDILKTWMDQAVARDMNIVHPIVGGKPEKVAAFVDEMMSLGYTVNIRLVNIPATESLKRMINRFGEEGRVIPPSYIMGIGDGPLNTFDNLKQRDGINAYSYFDNNVKFGQEPKIVESNDPAFPPSKDVPGDGSRSGSDGDSQARGEDQSQELGQIADDFFESNAYRLREYRDQAPARTDVEPAAKDRLDAAKANFDDLIKEDPNMMIDLDDGTRVKLSDYADMVKQNEKLLEAITTCRTG